jgi:TonB family protein
MRGCIALLLSSALSSALPVLLAAALVTACDDEEGYPPAAPSNDMSDVPGGAAEPGGSAEGVTPVTPPPGTPQPLGPGWTVPFPEEAQRSGVASSDVVLLVTVSSTGAVEDAAVLSDPGHGLGEAARTFARGQKFKPAVDASGTPIRASTRVRVHFHH